MAIPATTPRDMAPQPGEPGNRQPVLQQQQSGRWEREAEELHKSGPEDSVTTSSRIYFFVIVGIVAATFVVFLLLRPQ
ncbi:MAG TPA: hypothetical protein VN612_15165 [Acidobacteriaceae bacterium]|nr:hypothetical protein [Acidobacteriaceae bacterium]